MASLILDNLIARNQDYLSTINITINDVTVLIHAGVLHSYITPISKDFADKYRFELSVDGHRLKNAHKVVMEMFYERIIDGDLELLDLLAIVKFIDMYVSPDNTYAKKVNNDVSQQIAKCLRKLRCAYNLVYGEISSIPEDDHTANLDALHWLLNILGLEDNYCALVGVKSVTIRDERIVTCVDNDKIALQITRAESRDPNSTTSRIISHNWSAIRKLAKKVRPFIVEGFGVECKIYCDKIGIDEAFTQLIFDSTAESDNTTRIKYLEEMCIKHGLTI